MDRERQACPECNGSGVYQEYDEFDRYAVHACAKCDGSGELDLIDSALAEPSDEDIDRALDWILTGKYETQVGDHSYIADSRFHPDTSRFCNTIAQALRRYQKPTDEAVQRAIEDLESGYHRAEMLDDDYIDLPISTETIALAITALRQYQKPTDEAVRDCSTCIGCDCEPELGETVKDCKAYVKREPTDIADAIEAMTDNPLYNADIRKTILQALRQMRTEKGIGK